MAKKGEEPMSDARSATAASRYGVLLATTDGRFIQTSTLLPHQGKALCEVAGIGHVVEEPRFSRLPMFDTPEDAQAWEDLLLEAFRAEDLDHWLPLLEASPDIAFEVAVTSEEGLEHPQIVHNGDVITIDDPEVGPVRQVGPDRPLRAHARSSPTRSGARARASTPGRSRRRAGPAGGGDAPAHPFAGITIVEFGYFYAMPYGTAMAAALGARVIKIEDGNGDPHRMSFGPDVASNKTTAGQGEPLASTCGPRRAGPSPSRSSPGPTCSSPGSAPAWPTSSASATTSCRRSTPACSTSTPPATAATVPTPAGPSTPRRPRRSRAASAARSATGPTRPSNVDMSVIELQAVVLPRLAQVVDGDSNAALGVLAALALGIYHQQRTGEGQRLTTSMIGGNAWAYSDDFCSYEGKPPVPLCDDEYYGTSALDRVYPAAEGTWVCVAVPLRRRVRGAGRHHRAARAGHRRAVRRRGRPGRQRRRPGRRAGRPVRGEAGRRSGRRRSCAARVGCVAVNMQGQPAFTSFDPVLRETGLTVAFEHPLFGEMVRAAPPVAFSETPGRVAPPCLRGQHNRAILAELGYARRRDRRARGRPEP